MTLTAQRFGSAAALALVLGLLNLLSSSEPFAQGQSDCTVTVQPGQSIQQVIGEAPEGAVICLTIGTFRENLDIKKSLVLRGMGREQTQIENRTWGPVAFIVGDITVTLENLTIAGARGMQVGNGVYIGSEAQVTVLNSLVSGNEWNGLDVRDSSHVRVMKTTISDNGLSGIVIEDSAIVHIQQSEIKNNGVDEGCYFRDSYKRYLCQGIVLSNSSHLMLTDSSILGNADWGLTAILKSCRYSDLQVNVGEFTGQVNFRGTNKIEGNNKSGYLNGMGNPGNHPWNRPDVPDGQVCLP